MHCAQAPEKHLGTHQSHQHAAIWSTGKLTSHLTPPSCLSVTLFLAPVLGEQNQSASTSFLSVHVSDHRATEGPLALDEVRVQVQALAHAVQVKLHTYLTSLLPVPPQGQEAHLAGAWRRVQSHRADCTFTPAVLTATRGTDMLTTVVPQVASGGLAHDHGDHPCNMRTTIPVTQRNRKIQRKAPGSSRRRGASPHVQPHGARGANGALCADGTQESSSTVPRELICPGPKAVRGARRDTSTC